MTPLTYPETLIAANVRQRRKTWFWRGLCLILCVAFCWCILAVRAELNPVMRSLSVSEARATGPVITFPVQKPGGPESPPASAPGDLITQALDYIVLMESRNGQDPGCWPGRIGPSGERGPWQVTPIFIADIERLCGVELDPYDYWQCWDCVEMWLRHYAPRAGCQTIDDIHELYRRGPTGYRDWKKK